LEEDSVVVLKWQDKIEPLTLSTVHTGHVIEGTKTNRHNEPIKKHDCVFAYNTHMCGRSCYSPLRRTLKWYRKVVLQMLDMAVSNDFLLYRKAGGSCHRIWFRTQVIHCCISAEDRPSEVSVSSAALLCHKASELFRLTGHHYMEVIH